MQVKRLIKRRIRKAGSGIDLAADVNAVVSVNVNETGATTFSTTSRESTSPPARDTGESEDRGKEKS